MTSGTPRKTPKELKWNKTYSDKHGQSSYHQRQNEKNTNQQGSQRAATYGTNFRQ